MLLYWGLVVAAFVFWLMAIAGIVHAGAWVHLALCVGIALAV